MSDILLSLQRQAHFFGLAIGVGVVAAAAALALLYGIGLVQSLVFATDALQLTRWAGGLPGWHLMLVPALGGLLVGLLTRWLMPEGKPQGVAHVIEAATSRGEGLSLRTGLAAAAVSALSLGVGASAGREGPAVHFGASIGAWWAGWNRLDPVKTRVLLAAGVAAAVAASFNAPVAGAIFAHEVVLGYYALDAFGPVVFSAVTGTILHRLLHADVPTFTVPVFEFGSYSEFPAFILLGLLCGLVAVAFMRAVALVDGRIRKWTWLPTWSRPAVAGLAIGVTALLFPHILGVGYETMDLALRGQLPWSWMIWLLPVKMLATALSLGAGFSGGVFSPALFLGALAGGLFGTALGAVLPEGLLGHLAEPGAYALVGMGATAAAVLGAPISTTLMVFELTANYPLTMAVMLAIVVATSVSRSIHGQSFFTWQLACRGLHLRSGHDMAPLRYKQVLDLVQPGLPVVGRETGLAVLRSRLLSAPAPDTLPDILIVKAEGHFIGVISSKDLGIAGFDPLLDDLIIAEDVVRRDRPTLRPGDSLEHAMSLFAKSAADALPVTDAAGRFLGCVRERDMIRTYAQTLERRYVGS